MFKTVHKSVFMKVNEDIFLTKEKGEDILHEKALSDYKFWHNMHISR